MPSKYSHSAVLAQHSSLGLINLSHDQYVEYLKSFPLITISRPPREASSRPTSITTQSSSRASNIDHLRPQRGIERPQSSLSKQLVPRSSGGRTPQRRIIVADSESDKEDESSNLDRIRDPGQTGSTIHSSNSREEPPPAYNLSRKQNVNSKQPIRNKPHTQPRLNTPQTEGQEPDQPKDVTKPTFIVPSIPGVANEASERKPRQPMQIIPVVKASKPDIAPRKCASTPQKSSAGTDSIHLGNLTPPTPISMQQQPPSTILTKQRPDMVRDKSASSEITAIYNPAVMPTSPNFDDISDADQSRKEYMQPASVPQSTPRAVRKTKLQFSRAPPPVNRPTSRNKTSVDYRSSTYGSHMDSISPLSSLSHFGTPSVVRSPSQAKSRPARTMEIRAPSRAEASLELPSIRQSPFKTQFDSRFLDDTRTSSRASGRPKRDSAKLREFLGSLEDRFDVEEEILSDSDTASAAVPPDIGMHRTRNGVEDPLEQLEQMIMAHNRGLPERNQTPPLKPKAINGGVMNVEAQSRLKEKSSRSLFGRLTGRRPKAKC